MKIERVTITIKKEILEKIDRMIDGKNIRNRSHSIESLVTKSFRNIDTAIIFAGGYGVKLRPLTYEIPKPLIPVHGKPIIEHQVNMLRKSGISRIILSLGYMHEKVIESMEKKNLGINVEYVIEKKPCGTAGALYNSRKFIKDSFIAMNVDTLMNPDISEIAEFHKNNNSLATMLLVASGTEGGAATMRGNHIISFSENPALSKSKLTNAGFYVFEPGVLGIIPRKGSIEKELFPKLAKNQQLYGFMHDNPIYDTGTYEGYEKAIKEWKDVK